MLLRHDLNNWLSSIFWIDQLLEGTNCLVKTIFVSCEIWISNVFNWFAAEWCISQRFTSNAFFSLSYIFSSSLLNIQSLLTPVLRNFCTLFSVEHAAYWQNKTWEQHQINDSVSIIGHLFSLEKYICTHMYVKHVWD